MEDFLPTDICEEFRTAINSTPIFMYNEDYKGTFNLFCAVMDRMDSCIQYLNNHAEAPETEERFLFFIMYSCMVLDAVKHLNKALGLNNNKEDDPYKYFKEVCTSPPLNISIDKCPTDDKFFEYIRSLSMAHPFETNRPKFFKKGETHYSPWVIPHRKHHPFRNDKDGVGIRVYSNKFDHIQDIFFSFDLLKKYIRSRFIKIKLVTNEIYNIIHETENDWKNVHISSSLTPIETFKEIKTILQQRHEDTHVIESVIEYLEYTTTDPDNKEIVSLYKREIEGLVPKMIAYIKSLEHEKLHDILFDIIHPRPRFSHEMAHYQLEKIYGYLTPDHINSSDYMWGLQQAEIFTENFASKWVTINVNNMNATEIKLLVSTACYFEKKEQNDL